jgi:hypothetical protein
VFYVHAIVALFGALWARGKWIASKQKKEAQTTSEPDMMHPEYGSGGDEAVDSEYPPATALQQFGEDCQGDQPADEAKYHT